MVFQIIAVLILIIFYRFHIHSMFGTEYDEYKKHTMRYLGRS